MEILHKDEVLRVNGGVLFISPARPFVVARESLVGVCSLTPILVRGPQFGGVVACLYRDLSK